MKESTLTRRITDYLKRNRVWHVKLHGGPMQRAGLPDILCVVNGKAVFIEVKATKSDMLTRLQAATIMELKSHGACVFVIRDFDFFVKIWEAQFT